MATAQELEQVFQRGWAHSESKSGPGSTRVATEEVKKGIRRILPAIVKGRPAILNDAGCGDIAWVRDALPAGTDYTGYDVVEWDTWSLLRTGGWKLIKQDIILEPMRLADVTLCRGVMIHLPNDMVLSLLGNCQRSAKWLLATSYTSGTYGAYDRTFDNLSRIDKPTRNWSRLDLTLPPFSLGDPKSVIAETHGGKYLGLWDLRP